MVWCTVLQEAAVALSMNNLNLMGSLIKVELAASAYRASPQVCRIPFSQPFDRRLGHSFVLSLPEVEAEAQSTPDGLFRALRPNCTITRFPNNFEPHFGLHIVPQSYYDQEEE